MHGAPGWTRAWKHTSSATQLPTPETTRSCVAATNRHMTHEVTEARWCCKYHDSKQHCVLLYCNKNLIEKLIFTRLEMPTLEATSVSFPFYGWITCNKTTEHCKRLLHALGIALLKCTWASSTALIGAVAFARAMANASNDRGCVRGSGPSKLIGGESSGSVRRRTLAKRRGSVRARQAPFDI